MRNIICDECDKGINEQYYELLIYRYDTGQELEKEEEYEFCSERCMGKWMIEKAKEGYGVYE